LIWDVSKFTTIANGESGKFNAVPYWNDLRGADAGRAFDAICAMTAAPAETLPFLKEHLRPYTVPDTETLQRLIADLDSEEFSVRKKASTELDKVGKTAVPLLRKALKDDPSLEARRRIEELLRKAERIAPGGELLRSLRAIEVLEMIGTAEAK